MPKDWRLKEWFPNVWTINGSRINISRMLQVSKLQFHEIYKANLERPESLMESRISFNQMRLGTCCFRQMVRRTLLWGGTWGIQGVRRVKWVWTWLIRIFDGERSSSEGEAATIPHDFQCLFWRYPYFFSRFLLGAGPGRHFRPYRGSKAQIFEIFENSIRKHVSASGFQAKSASHPSLRHAESATS